MENMVNSAPTAEPVTTYREEKINGTLYRVTSVFKGEIELQKALEDLTVRRVAREALAAPEKM